MNNDVSKAFGLPFTISGFADGKDRKLYPFKMKEIGYFFDLLNKINIDNLIVNFIIDEDGKFVKEFFSFCFKEDPIEDFEENINISNFKPIMTSILDELGLDLGGSKNVERE